MVFREVRDGLRTILSGKTPMSRWNCSSVSFRSGNDPVPRSENCLLYPLTSMTSVAFQKRRQAGGGYFLGSARSPGLNVSTGATPCPIKYPHCTYVIVFKFITMRQQR